MGEPLTKERERELMRRVKQGDVAARDALMYALVPWIRQTVHRYCKKRHTPPHFDPEDAVQEACIRVERYLSRFDLGKRLRLVTYLHQHVVGAARDLMRKDGPNGWSSRNGRELPIVKELSQFRLRDHRLSDDEAESQVEASLGEQDRPRMLEMDSLHYLLRGLPKTARLALLLYYVHDERMIDIGEQLGLSESRVSQIITNAKQFLRERLTREGFGPCRRPCNAA